MDIIKILESSVYYIYYIYIVQHLDINLNQYWILRIIRFIYLEDSISRKIYFLLINWIFYKLYLK